MIERTMQDVAGTIDGGASPSSAHAAMPEPTRREVRADRRTYSFETLRHSLIAPRRTSARRGEDRRYPMLDRFDAGMLTLAVTLVGLSILDSLFTLMLLAAGGNELNPVMAAALGHGIWVFTALKMTMTAVPALILVATGNLPVFGMRARSILAALVGLYAGLIVYELALLSLV